MTRHEFLLPDLGEGIAEAEVISWFAEEGDEVKEHQPLLEVQTDKALVELPAPVTGILVSHGAPVGGVVKLGGLVATFESDAGVEPAVAALAAAGAPAPRTATADAPVLSPVSAPAEAARPVAPEAADSTRIPLRGLRRTIARRMTETLRTVPHVSGLLDVDVTDLAELLKGLRPTAEAEGVRLTWTAVFALATSPALQEFPQ